MVDLDTAADELYGAAPEEFVERRKALVAAARKAGDRPLSQAIGALRRPTRSAWLVNLLAREAPDDIAELLSLGAALRQAQADLSGPELRRLSAERHRAVQALGRQAAALAAARGQPATEASLAEVSSTLQAALAEQSVAESVQAGRVAQAVAYGGFGPLPDTPVAAAPTPPAADSEAADHEEPGPPGTADQEEAAGTSAPDAAQQRAAELTAAWTRAVTEAGEVEDAATEATRRADELAEGVDRLRHQLRAAEAAKQTARKDARAARRRATELRETAEEAERELSEAGVSKSRSAGVAVEPGR